MSFFAVYFFIDEIKNHVTLVLFGDDKWAYKPKEFRRFGTINLPTIKWTIGSFFDSHTSTE